MLTQSSISVEEFAAAFRHHPGGVSLITAIGPNGPVALTATSVASVSTDPPLLMFSVSTGSSSHPALTSTSTVVVHLLGAEHLHLATLGATSGIDRFADRSLWRPLATGEPLFAGPPWIRAEAAHHISAGNATVIVARAIESGPARVSDGDGLVYLNRSWHRIGQHTILD